MGGWTKMEVSKRFKQLEENKVVLIPDAIDGMSEYVQEKPQRIGTVTYDKKTGVELEHKMTEQVQGSLARYNHPIYRDLHYKIKGLLEKVFDLDLYPTYYYDRFYSSGQELKKHVDRPSCEISVSLFISSNTEEPWPLYFDTPIQGEIGVITIPGDICVYKGCEVVHWRTPLQGDDNTYHHQLFLHYVNANGNYLQFAYDNR